MEKIWANRIVAGTKTLNDVPEKRKEAVIAELKERFNEGILTEDKLNEILGIKKEEELN